MARNVERAEAREITAEVEAAIAEVFAKRGMTVGVSAVHYGETYGVKLTGIVTDLDPETGINNADPKVADWRRYARSFDLPEAGLGAEFKSGGRTFKVTGLAVNRRSKPVCAVEVASGKPYIFPADAAKALLMAAGVK